jgi:hypothetical protein
MMFGKNSYSGIHIDFRVQVNKLFTTLWKKLEKNVRKWKTIYIFA